MKNFDQINSGDKYVPVPQFTCKIPEKRRFTEINVQERFFVFLRENTVIRRGFFYKI
jgi:hypothetical protein